MLNFKKTTLIVLFLTGILLVVANSIAVPVWTWIIIGVVYLTLITYGSANVRSQFFMPVVSGGSTDSNKVAITFDDGPAEKHTNEILDILKKNNVPATFFCIGSRVKNHPELAKRITGEGHLIANHSYSHSPVIDLFPESKLYHELRDTNDEIIKATGLKPALFRPPYGVTTPPLAGAVKKNGMKTVGWTLRSLDTIAKSEEQLTDKIKKKIKGGDIILLHDTRQVTVRSLQKIIDIIREKGFEPVRADELTQLQPYA